LEIPKAMPNSNRRHRCVDQETHETEKRVD